MWIEMVGLPGSGKSTLLRNVLQVGRHRKGVPVLQGGAEALHETLLSGHGSRVIGWLLRKSPRSLTTRIFRDCRASGFRGGAQQLEQFATRYDACHGYLSQAIIESATGFDAQYRMQEYWLNQSVITFQLLKDRPENVLIDEGFVQRWVSNTSVGEGLANAVPARRATEFVRALPDNILCIHLGTPLEECVRRLSVRGRTKRMEAMEEWEIHSYMHQVGERIDECIQEFQSLGRPLIRVEPGERAETVRDRILEAIDSPR